jgi:PPM family protein phosphatase
VLRVAEQAFRSDTGRQRTANEDSYYVRAPIFAVADGMGGAQAGEVASQIAADEFEPAERGDLAPEPYLRAIAERANERIHELAQSDTSRSGMGTTLTAALVEDDEVSLAHVGDSRAYLFRDGELKLLTSDHSLVEELRRQGRLTSEQAQDHPQRSIITRALGPERAVEIDTMTYRARPGDMYLLCSDGLTTMVAEERIAEVLREAAALEEAVSRLVREANEAGGRDNVTVVAFRLEDAEAAAVPDEDKTLVGPAAAEAGLTPEGLRAEARREHGRAERAAPRRRRVPLPVKALIGVLALAGVAALAYLGWRQVYFLGADEGGRLALYRGLPYELPLGIDLYDEIYSVPVQVSSLPAARLGSATDHELRSRDDAISLLEDLEDSAMPAPSQPPEGGGAERPGTRPEDRRTTGDDGPRVGPGDGGSETRTDGSAARAPRDGPQDTRPGG